MDGRAYLEKLIADRLGAGRGKPALGRRSSFDLAWVRGVAVGLVAAGALGQDEMERIIADLVKTLVDTGWLTVLRGSASAAGSGPVITPEMTAPTGVARPEWRVAIVDPPPPVLRGVVSLAGRRLAVGGKPASLISLEVWSTGLTLRLAHSDADARTLMRRLGDRDSWSGWDDQGTQFHGAGGAGGGSHALFVEEVSFEPGPAGRARTLTLRVDHDGRSQRLTIALDSLASPG
jgi:hypothetical protein